MKQISASLFFTVLWGGVCQALGWFFGLFGYKRDGKLAKCIWGLFATSGAIVMAFFALALVCAGVEVVYDRYYKPHYCDDEYCYHSPDGVNATRPRGSNARGFSNIRRANKISPTAAQGKVANIAREQAKEYLRQHQPFVWNATNITVQMRESLISLFETYHAHVRIVYLETDWQTLLERNLSREDAVPQSVIEEMMGKMTLPEACEARKVEWRSV